MKPIIRPFESQDADGLAALWHASWQSTGVQAAAQVTLADLRKRIDQELSDGWKVSVAEHGRGLVGFIALKLDAHCLDQLFIAPSAKNLGIGKSLFALAMAAMPGGFWLHTAAENREAIDFYDTAGMKFDHIEPHPALGHETAIYALGTPAASAGQAGNWSVRPLAFANRAALTRLGASLVTQLSYLIFPCGTGMPGIFSLMRLIVLQPAK